ncbi:hypothetical protein CPB86DRAFT_65590 [Serendipita vermifera]|nr:hypothetical protein CPB86DRAFT_65590 [Serendipita vermifera]
METGSIRDPVCCVLRITTHWTQPAALPSAIMSRLLTLNLAPLLRTGRALVNGVKRDWPRGHSKNGVPLGYSPRRTRTRHRYNTPEYRLYLFLSHPSLLIELNIVFRSCRFHQANTGSPTRPCAASQQFGNSGLLLTLVERQLHLWASRVFILSEKI